jgi:Raf kinase inhibitor-like YbhB/YbcL family protein
MTKRARIITAIVIIFLVGAGIMGVQLVRDTLKQNRGGSMVLSSSAFNDGQMMPSLFAYRHENINPPLEFMGVPKEAKSLALIVHDPDAPSGDYTHWLVWNIPVTSTQILENAPPLGAVQGTNDFGNTRWDGPAPPSGVHHYHFVLYALDSTLAISAESKRPDIKRAMSGHILEQTELVGLYRAE